VRAIITFHSIDDTDSLLSFHPKVFDALLSALAQAALPVCELDELLASDSGDGIALTFDDGMGSVFTHALPALRAHGAPAHLFLTTDAVGADNRWSGQPLTAPHFQMLDWPQIEALHAAGVRIESHTARHPDLRAFDDEAIEEECREADEVIAQRLGRPPRYFAYPYGFHDARVRSIIARRYEAGLTTELRVLHDSEDRAALPRLDSYYLRPAWAHHNLGARTTQAYLRLRHWLRRFRATA
jgi:peptidoglycan/xylan/chitin deacetylase (PgdA/CDA1 family)